MEKDQLVFFTMGFLFGVVIILLMVIITYVHNVGLFEHCVNNKKVCLGDDYYATPTEAIRNGHSASDILYKENGILKYSKVQKTSDCVPSHNKIIEVYPQYCLFKDENGKEYEGKMIKEGTNVYLTYLDQIKKLGKIVVEADYKCTPLKVETKVSDINMVSGEPSEKWDTY